jgi:hypothetical protein
MAGLTNIPWTPWLQDRPCGSAGWAAISAGLRRVWLHGGRMGVVCCEPWRVRAAARQGQQDTSCLSFSSICTAMGPYACPPRGSTAAAADQRHSCWPQGTRPSHERNKGPSPSSCWYECIHSTAYRPRLSLAPRPPGHEQQAGGWFLARREHVSCTMLFASWAWLLRLCARCQIIKPVSNHEGFIVLLSSPSLKCRSWVWRRSAQTSVEERETQGAISLSTTRSGLSSMDARSRKPAGVHRARTIALHPTASFADHANQDCPPSRAHLHHEWLLRDLTEFTTPRCQISFKSVLHCI